MVERKCDLHKILNNFDLIKDNWEKSPCYPNLYVQEYVVVVARRFVKNEIINQVLLHYTIRASKNVLVQT